MAHKTESVRELIDKMGKQTTLGLPIYSPDLNPTMQEGFSKIKDILLLHKVKASSLKVCWKRKPVPLGAVIAGDAQESFDHCRYRSLDQLL